MFLTEMEQMAKTTFPLLSQKASGRRKKKEKNRTNNSNQYAPNSI